MTALTIAQLVILTGQAYSTVDGQMKRGYCKYPKHEKNGQTSNPAYLCWQAMVRRCDPSYSESQFYGGRGIRLHPDFIGFQKFLEHIGPRPSVAHSIDRIDNAGNYEPGNVRWATPAEQARNTRQYRGGVSISQDSRSVAKGHTKTWKAEVKDSCNKRISKRFITEEEAIAWSSLYAISPTQKPETYKLKS